jgi:hypothetical protein
MFTVGLFIIAINGNSQDASQLMNGLRKCDIYIWWNFTQHKEEWNFVAYKQMDGTGEHHLKCI